MRVRTSHPESEASGRAATPGSDEASAEPSARSSAGIRAGRPSLCVVNYNGARYLPGTLGTLRARRAEFAEALLVDDASTDGSVDAARRAWPELPIVCREHNGGPGSARNMGAAVLRARRILFIDNDVAPEPGCVRRLTAALDADPTAVIAMPRVVHRRRPQRIQFEGAESHTSGLQVLRHAERSRRAVGAGPARPVTSLVSACFLFDRDRWGPYPLFDERLEMYFEDHELGLRATLRGLKLLVVPAAACRHGEGTPGISIRETGRATPVRVRNTILNRWQVVLKLYQGRTLLLMAPSLALFEIFQLGGAVTVGWLRHWLAAVARLAAMAPDLLRRRRAFRRRRRLPDGAVLRSGPHPFRPSLARKPPVRALRRLLDRATDTNWTLARHVAWRLDP